MKATAVELAFADRYSLAALKTSEVLALSIDQLKRLAERLANDILLFNQQACSSPRSIFWIGGTEDEICSARARFWQALEDAASRFPNPPHAVIARITDAFLLAASGGVSDIYCRLNSFPLRGFGNRITDPERRLHGGNGFLTEYSLDHLAQLASRLCARDQTLVAFGFMSEELVALTRQLPGRAVDRIVGPGEALNFDPVWDGMDLFAVLTREIRINKPVQL
ncbi:Acyl-CoA reductase (LuxC) superfamily protein (fragment) [Candidatus Accumulibacter aalborgensis]|uniref:Acyl-CoA reductase (LuxC) superfamily protein n=1 Tax=Candidatus Accumulibacter aalborgensis TaxID=1860102 RepID=A0A1A8XH89_9PROT